MKAFTSSSTFKPFEHLKTMLKKRGMESRLKTDAIQEKRTGSYHGGGLRETASYPRRLDSGVEMSDEALFNTAMADVTPIRKANRVEKTTHPSPGSHHISDPEFEAMTRLRRLVELGEGFIVAQTPEYMEGTAWGVHPEIATRLHNGVYAIQSHIDLHGHGIRGAREMFDRFLKESIIAGRRTILIVHGRGLSSPSKPVLKPMVFEWLTSGPWRKWVLAFTSARRVDGGAGATVILLRKKPRTKSLKKQFGPKGHREFK